MHSKTSTLIVFVLAVASSYAQADTAVSVKTETVRYDDIRMTSPVGIAVLYGRLKGAAARACTAPDSNADLKGKARFRACYDDAMARAVATVNNPALTQFYEEKRGTFIPNPVDQSVTVVAKGE